MEQTETFEDDDASGGRDLLEAFEALERLSVCFVDFFSDTLQFKQLLFDFLNLSFRDAFTSFQCLVWTDHASLGDLTSPELLNAFDMERTLTVEGSNLIGIADECLAGITMMFQEVLAFEENLEDQFLVSVPDSDFIVVECEGTLELFFIWTDLPLIIHCQLYVLFHNGLSMFELVLDEVRRVTSIA